GDLTLFGLTQTRVGQRMRAGAALFFRERAQHDAGRLESRSGHRRGRSRRRDSRRFSGRDPALRHGTAIRGRYGFRLDLAWTSDAALHLLDHNRLAAAMAEALPHDALLDAAAALQRQRLR